jgi:hypothetical protein
MKNKGDMAGKNYDLGLFVWFCDKQYLDSRRTGKNKPRRVLVSPAPASVIVEPMARQK